MTKQVTDPARSNSTKSTIYDTFTRQSDNLPEEISDLIYADARLKSKPEKQAELAEELSRLFLNYSEQVFLVYVEQKKYIKDSYQKRNLNDDQKKELIQLIKDICNGTSTIDTCTPRTLGLIQIYYREKAELILKIIYKKYEKTADGFFDYDLIYSPLKAKLELYPFILPTTRSALFRSAKSEIFRTLSPVQLVTFAMNSLPLFSKLKRMLIKKNAYGRPYYQYILYEVMTDKRRSRFLADNQRLEETLMAAAETGDYDYPNDFAVMLIAAAVDIRTDYGKADGKSRGGGFIHVISPWFKEGTFYSTPEQGNVKADAIYRIAYALSLGTDELDYLCEAVPNAYYYPFDFTQTILRFGLVFHMRYNDAMQMVMRYDHAVQEGAVKSSADFLTALDKFYAEHENAPEPPEGAFFSLLEEYNVLGNVQVEKEKAREITPDGTDREKQEETPDESAKKKLRWNTGADAMFAVRCNAARNCIIETEFLLSSLNKKQQERLRRIFLYSAELLDTAPVQERLQEISELTCRRIPMKAPIIRDAAELTAYYQESFCRMKTQNIGTNAITAALVSMCDGQHVYETERFTGKSLTSTLINQIMDGKVKSPDAIDRGIALRLAFLHTVVRSLVHAIKSDDKEENSTETPASLPFDVRVEFERKAGEMLAEMGFPGLNVSLPLDLILFITVSEDWVFPAPDSAKKDVNEGKDKWVMPKSLAYQLWLPRTVQKPKTQKQEGEGASHASHKAQKGRRNNM